MSGLPGCLKETKTDRLPFVKVTYVGLLPAFTVLRRIGVDVGAETVGEDGEVESASGVIRGGDVGSESHPFGK
ncbi:hypothetical protein ACMD2_17472 [Ananas comosus]|uniref:Uncharacterized protein n=1 Tax=Ananas comosus TaxID=4615 RepID=A0A199VWL1_ANACO|nr:hypothetical protein ACMD2_17472 [Ananas comosus]